MSKLICPFCQQELNDNYYMLCNNPYCNKTTDMSGTEDLWQELIRTRKALEIAVDALKRIDDIYKLNGVGVQEGIFMGEYAHKALLAVLSPEEAQMRTLEQITALEQKD